MSAWIAALRIARREVWRAKGRSALVLAMIALPVGVLSYVATIYDTFQLTPREQVEREMGQADGQRLWIREMPDVNTKSTNTVPATRDQVVAALPQGSRATPNGRTSVRLRTDQGLVHFDGRIVDAGDPITRGILSIVDGVAPTKPDQIALTARAARALGATIGDQVGLLEPEGEFTVTGIAEFAESFNPTVVFPPASAASGLAGGSVEWLIQTPSPITWEQADQLNHRGIQITTREMILAPDSGEWSLVAQQPEGLAVGVLVIGLAVLEVVLLAGPAFAVSARRRARDLALIAAAGAAPKHLRRIVLADGVVLGVIGALGGIVVGVGAAAGSRNLFEVYVTHTRGGALRVFPLALLGIAVLAVGTGMAAAAVPAANAARQDIVAVLGGRRPNPRSRRRWVVTGLVMTAMGVVIAGWGATMTSESLILLGIVSAELGLVLTTPALIGLISRLGRWLPLAPRLALRDAARNRASAAPAVSAIMGAVAGAVSIGVFASGAQAQQMQMYQPVVPVGHVLVGYYGPDPGSEQDWAEIEAAARRALPSATVQLYRVPICGNYPCDVGIVATSGKAGDIWAMSSIVDDGQALELLTGADPEQLAQARRVLAAGGMVVPDPSYLVGDEAYITVMTPSKDWWALPPPITIPGIALPGIWGGRAIVSPQAMAQLGWQSVPGGLAIDPGQSLTVAQEDDLYRGLQKVATDVSVYVERGPQPPNEPISLILALAAAVIALGAAAIATGLAAAERRADLATLAAVGAAPRVRRGLALSQAGVISVLGAALGVAAGLGGAAAMIFAMNRIGAQLNGNVVPVVFGVPWQTLAIVVAVPLIAMAGAGLLTRSQLPIERRF